MTREIYALTQDGVPVYPGDKVWVIGSIGIHEAIVKEPVTNYELFGPIPVKHSFSSKEKAEKSYYRKDKYSN